jgi:hypothetical protein
VTIKQKERFYLGGIEGRLAPLNHRHAAKSIFTFEDENAAPV